ncbi:MAG: hypothetical protein R2712_16925 [Vicinamibacterales bacterium]
MSAAVRASLVEMTPTERMVALLIGLDPEDLGYVWSSLPRDLVDDVTRAPVR